MNTRHRSPLSAWSVLCMTLVSGCGSGLPSGFLGNPATLSGQIARWTYGPGHTLVAQLFRMDWPQLASAPIDETGHFSITLPSLAELRKDPYALGEKDAEHEPSPHCTGELQSSANAYQWRGVVFSFTGKHAGGVVYNNKSTANPRLIEAEFFYSGNNFWQRGELNCQRPEVFDGHQYVEGRVSWAVAYEPGLNRLFTTRSRLRPPMPTDSYTSESAPADVEWVQE